MSCNPIVVNCEMDADVTADFPKAETLTTKLSHHFKDSLIQRVQCFLSLCVRRFP